MYMNIKSLCYTPETDTASQFYFSKKKLCNYQLAQDSWRAKVIKMYFHFVKFTFFNFFPNEISGSRKGEL